jgi:hypothetical protein
LFVVLAAGTKENLPAELKRLKENKNSKRTWNLASHQQTDYRLSLHKESSQAAHHRSADPEFTDKTTNTTSPDNRRKGG